MEEFAKQLKAALNHYGVYIGPESLTRQPQLPHVIVIPVEETLTPPMRSGAGVQLAAEAQQTVDIICRADTYEQARALALLCWQMPGIDRNARMTYGSETWESKVVRSVRLRAVLPLAIARSDITLARIEFIGQHVRYEVLTAPEVQDDPQKNPGTGTVRSDFHEHADPRHRFGPDE